MNTRRIRGKLVEVGERKPMVTLTSLSESSSLEALHEARATAAADPSSIFEDEIKDAVTLLAQRVTCTEAPDPQPDPALDRVTLECRAYLLGREADW